MANTIRIKRSNVAGRAPSTLPYGELAINAADKVLYFGNASNVPVALGGGGGHAVKASGYYTVAGSTVTAVASDKMTVNRTSAGVYRVTVTGSAKATDLVLLACSDQYSIAKTGGDPAAGFTVTTRNIGFVGHPIADAPDFSIAVVG